MKIVLLSILTVLSVGCQSYHDTYGTIVTEPTIQEHLNTYMLEKFRATGDNFVYYDIKFELAYLPGNEIGTCHMAASKKQQRIISIDTSFWFQASDLAREQLIMHEMGHCDLDKHGHDTDGIMRPTQLGDSYYETWRFQLLRDLFEKSEEII